MNVDDPAMVDVAAVVLPSAVVVAIVAAAARILAPRER